MNTKIATLATALLREAGITEESVLQELGIDRKQAVREVADKLGVDINELADQPSLPDGDVREVSDADLARVRQALPILNRAFG